MGKRGNGEGSIIQRKDGRWQASLTLSVDPKTKKAKRQYFYGKTRKETLSKLDEARQQQKDGISIEPNKITVSQWLDKWLLNYMKPHLRPTTYDSYRTKVEKHIKPDIGAIQLRKLQTNHLQKLYNDKLKDGRIDGKGGLSARSVRYIHAVIHHALEQAIKEQILTRNVADAVILPGQKRKEIKPLTTEQVQQLLSSIKDDRLYAAYMLELGTGLRRGELLGLRWQDLDFERKTIQVQQSLVRTSEFGLVFQEPKTNRSRRSIPLPDSVVKELKTHKATQSQEKLLVGPKYKNFGLIFCREDGRPLDPGEFSRRFSKLLEQAGLPHVRFHDLRHTHATQLLQLGVHVKVVQERLGHSTITMTLDTYSHVIPGLQEEAAARMNGILEPKKNPSTKEG